MGSPVIHPGMQPFLQIWYGIPGTGKSYQLAHNQVSWLEEGHPVVTNLAIKAMPYRLFGDRKKWGEYLFLQNEDFECTEDTEPAFVAKIAEVKARNPGKHILLVIDEAPDFYSAEDQRKLSKPLRRWVRKHRHVDVSIVLTAQNYSMLPKVFRDLTARFRVHENLVNDPVLNILLWWFADNFHIAYSMTGMKGAPWPKDRFDRRYFWIRGKTVGKMYDTTQMHSSSLQGGIRKAKGKALRWVFGCIMLALVFGAGAGIKWLIWPKGRKPASPAAVRAKPEPMDLCKISSVMGLNGCAVLELEGPSGEQRFVTVPVANTDDVFELMDKVGETTSVPRVTPRPFGEVIKERFGG